MSNFAGTWKMKSSENFDELLKTLEENRFLSDTGSESQELVLRLSESKELVLSQALAPNQYWNQFSGKVLLGVNSMLRKVAGAAASNPHVEIRQDGEQFYIKTSTTVRTTEINFHIGEEFNEETVDGRKCKSLATWESENKIYCQQTLVDGDGPKTFWTRELNGDELTLVFGADDVVCKRIYVRQ